ncbi:MAG: outer membrane beta-barrel domain-containing protein [Bdellovibrionales bacterium]|nr:outer membrane beta-barrel domain-containing protein [Bdellovibrionales bacterium]
MKKLLIIAALFTFSGNSRADDIMKDFDSLGGNDVLLERAQALSPEIQTKVVQNRIVDLNKRFEIAPETSAVLGGDSYTSTWLAGVDARFHINPRWSIGLKYGHAFNEYTDEGKNLINNPTPIKNGSGSIVGYAPNIPAVDYIKQQGFLTVNWSPIYGKMNMFDLGVVHFDMYAIAGAGQIELNSGPTSSYTAGGGIGLWISKHLTSHFEVRYQNYEAQRYPDKKDPMDLTIGSFQIGYLL